MGKRRSYRFPQGINGLSRLLYPNLHSHPQASPADLNGTRYFDISSEEYDNRMYSPTDPFGQYTGLPADGGLPLQDADDL
jgi:hypothetical protein